MHARTNVAKAITSAVDAFAELVLERLSRTTKKGRANGAVRHLDMKCRVAGCKERSRGPRFGYICDAHRAKLGKREQKAAREAYRAKGT